MKKFPKKFIGIFLSIFFFAQISAASTSRNLTIFAEQNMALALTKIARIYSQKSNVIVSVNFNSSSELISEIDSGEPADIFISAHHGWIESLRQKGVVDVYNVGYIASDELVLATSKSNPNIPAELQNKKIILADALAVLNRERLTLILDNENNSSGNASNNFIKHFSFENLKLFHKLNEDKSPFISIIKSNSENYALLLASQIKNEPNFQTLASKKDENIFYQALVIAGDNMEIAREFLKFLKSDTSKIILRENGFIVN